MPVRKPRLAILIGVALLIAASARASELSDDLKARRARVMERLGPDAIAILWSAPAARYSLDIDYEYRQDSNLYYLTGLTQEETILVLMPGNESRREILFIRDRNPVREHWTGHRLTHEEATERTGIDTVFATSQFESFVAAMLDRRGVDPVDEKQAARLFDALAAGRGRVALTLDAGRGLNGPLSAPLELAHKIRERFVGFQVTDATPILTTQRMVKTAYERRLLIRSLEISSEAQMAGMRAARPGAYEYEVTAAGSSLEEIHKKTVEVIKAGLLKLGLITDTSGNQYRMWYTHGASHYIGIDVHDVGDRRAPLAPGMAFVIEPGIYIRPSALDSLPRTPENNALIDKIQPAVKKYADIGVRVEDSFVLEESGLRRLSASVPRTIEEIEAFLRKRQAPVTAQR